MSEPQGLADQNRPGTSARGSSNKPMESCAAAAVRGQKAATATVSLPRSPQLGAREYRGTSAGRESSTGHHSSASEALAGTSSRAGKRGGGRDPEHDVKPGEERVESGGSSRSTEALPHGAGQESGEHGGGRASESGSPQLAAPASSSSFPYQPWESSAAPLDTAGERGGKRSTSGGDIVDKVRMSCRVIELKLVWSNRAQKPARR